MKTVGKTRPQEKNDGHPPVVRHKFCRKHGVFFEFMGMEEKHKACKVEFLTYEELPNYRRAIPAQRMQHVNTNQPWLSSIKLERKGVESARARARTSTLR